MTEETQVAGDLRKILNSHGHSFHYAVVRRVDDLHRARRSSWMLEGAEYPVVGGGGTTHVDFVLRSASARTILVAECKRADPARARWCFVRAPYTQRDPRDREAAFDQFVHQTDNWLKVEPCYRPVPPSPDRGPYHLGVELKTHAVGDGRKEQSAGAINHGFVTLTATTPIMATPAVCNGSLRR